MRARLGINTCFAVKRWPWPDDWARIVRDELGLEIVELSLDLIEDIGGPPGRERAADQIRSALNEYGLRAETVFTGLAAYSLNLLMHPDEERRRAATDWYLGVVDLAGEPLGGAALHDLGLDHADHVGGALVLVLHRLLEGVVELLLECH